MEHSEYACLSWSENKSFLCGGFIRSQKVERDQPCEDLGNGQTSRDNNNQSLNIGSNKFNLFWGQNKWSPVSKENVAGDQVAEMGRDDGDIIFNDFDLNFILIAT